MHPPRNATPVGVDPTPAPARTVRPRRGRRLAATVFGLVAIGLIGAFAWSEMHPVAMAEAEAAYRRNDLETALRKAREHLARRPFGRSAPRIAGLCLSRLDRPDQAEPYYEKAGSLAPEDEHTRAFGLVRGNKAAEAIRAYEAILSRRPDDILALRRLAGAQMGQGLWHDVLATADRLIAIPQGRVIGHTLAGVVHHDTENPESAVIEFGRVLELDPELKRMPLSPRSMFWSYYGQDLLAVGLAAEAGQVLHRAILEGRDAKIADMLGQSYYQRGEGDEAERCWRLALEWERDRAETWWRIGRLELQRGRPAEAIEPLRRAAELDPRAIGPVYSLGVAYRLLGRRQEADASQEQLVRLRARAAPTRGGMGTVPGRAS
jgi:tetratricopeptide (TPR) repeat protein